MESVYTRRDKALRRWQTLKTEREDGWEGHWRSIANNLLPRHSRILTTERNRGGDRNQHIIDSAGTRAQRVLAAGMMAGMTSPARPWFRLSTSDEELQDDHEVRRFFAETTSLILRAFRQSNTYNMLHHMYRELSGFGTGCNILLPDFQTVIHNTPLTIGEYALELDHKGFVNKLGREFELAVEQAAEWFGLDSLSREARMAYDTSNYGYHVKVLHIIEPNNERKMGAAGPRGMAFKSCYWDYAKTDVNHGLLDEGGFRRFPAITPRWDVLWNDVYGSSPGMEALGDLLQLQHEQLRKGKAIDYMTDPPLQVPTSLRGSGNADFLPGGVTYYDGVGPGSGVRAAFEVNLDPNLLLEDIRDVRERIDSAFYVDMFLMLSQADKNMTATEVAERHEEKLLMLGPVLERLHNEMLKPLVMYTFERFLQAGALPPLPESLNGKELQVEFISTLAQAQKAVSVNATDRLLGHIGMLVELKGDPSPADKFNADQSIERYADQLGVDPDLITSSGEVALVRQQRAEAQAAAAQMEQMQMMADAAGKMGNVQTGSQPQDNAARDIMNLFSGYQSPSAVEAE